MHLHRTLFAACLAMTAAPALAAPETQGPAPPGTDMTRYCIRVEALTGSHIETVQCWTRAEWADQDVDVDQVWSRDGVRVIG
jgi:hypothetical protein